MNESEFWSKHVRVPLSTRGHAVRIEDAIGSGVPDVNFATGSVNAWIELKIDRSGWLYFERFQLPWMRQRLAHNRDVWVLVLNRTTWDGVVKTKVKLHHASAIVKCPAVKKSKWACVKAEEPAVAASGKLAGEWDHVLEPILQRAYDREEAS